MNFNDYQNFTETTAIYREKLSSQKERMFYCVLGLANEAGEVNGVVKKLLRDTNGEINQEFIEKTSKELGDVLYYLASTCRELGLSLDQVAQENIDKLNDRKNRGVLQGSGDNR